MMRIRAIGLLAVMAGVTSSVLAACGADDSPQAASTTVEVSTTAGTDTTTVPPLVSTTAAPESTTPPPPITTLPPVVEPPVDDEAILDAFGLLGAAPVLDIRLLATDGALCGVAGDPTAQAARIHGGVLVAARPDSYEDRTDVTRLAAVDADGTIRWERCLEGVQANDLVAPVSADAATALTVSYRYDGSRPEPEWRAFDLGTGSDGTVPAGLQGMHVFDSDGTTMLVGTLHWWGGAATAGVDRFAVVDLTTLEIVDIGLPEVVIGEERSGLSVELGSGDRPWASGPAGSAVYVDGGWSSDPGVIDATLPIRVEFVYGDGRSILTGHAPLGTVIWTRPDLWDPPREGFRIGPPDTTVLVSACIRENVMMGCEEVFVGIDPATGEERWREEGQRWVPASGDGLALVTMPEFAGYAMIDVATGALASDTRWAAGSFEQGCCGDEWTWVQRFDGVVVAHALDHARVWYPAAATAGATVEVVFSR